MDWYQHFNEQLKTTDSSFTGEHLYIALCIGLSEATFATKDDLKDLTQAYNEYREEIIHEAA